MVEPIRYTFKYRLFVFILSPETIEPSLMTHAIGYYLIKRRIWPHHCIVKRAQCFSTAIEKIYNAPPPSLHPRDIVYLGGNTSIEAKVRFALIFSTLNFNNDFIRGGRSHRNNHKCRVNSESIVVQNWMGRPHALRTHQKLMQIQDVQLRMTLCFDILIALNTIHHLARLTIRKEKTTITKIKKALLKLYYLCTM